jgi:hypothetical protein
LAVENCRYLLRQSGTIGQRLGEISDQNVAAADSSVSMLECTPRPTGQLRGTVGISSEPGHQGLRQSQLFEVLGLGTPTLLSKWGEVSRQSAAPPAMPASAP